MMSYLYPTTAFKECIKCTLHPMFMHNPFVYFQECIKCTLHPMFMHKPLVYFQERYDNVRCVFRHPFLPHGVVHNPWEYFQEKHNFLYVYMF